jgi:hypothetical protein
MATYDSAIPGGSQIGQAALAAKTAYQQALARINQKRGSALRQYGFQGDIDPTSGVLRNTRVDPNNQYGAFQMANRSQASRDEQTRNAALERGLGSGGGLAAQLRERGRFDFGREDAEIGTGLIEGLAGYQDEQNQAGYARDSALYQAELEAARFGIQNEDWSPTDYSGLDIPEYGSTVDPVVSRNLPPGLRLGSGQVARLGGAKPARGYAPKAQTFVKPPAKKKPLLPVLKAAQKVGAVAAKKKK